MVTNNPAGRLVNVLTRYEVARKAEQSGGMRAVWAEVFGAAASVEAARHFVLVAEVADAAQTYADATGDGHAVTIVAKYADDWAAPFLHPPVGAGSGWNSEAGAVPDGALDNLKGLASLFSATSSEGQDVDPGARDDFRTELDALIQQTREDATLDRGLRALVLKRLHQIATALDHYEATGPGGLDEASQMLLVTIAVTSHDKPEVRKRLQPLIDFGQRVYLAVAFVGATGDAAVAIGMAKETIRAAIGGP